MIPIWLKIHGIAPFSEDLELDFNSVPGDVVAIVGANGSGKTQLIESMFAALYRILPSRGSIYQYCLQRDASIELAFSLPSGDYLSRIIIDSHRRTQEAWLFKGSDPLNDGQTKQFDSLITDLLGPKEVVLASSFACQEKRGSFVKLAKAERKDLFITMLGLEKLNKISQAASERAREAQSTIDSIKAAIDALRSGIPAIEDEAPYLSKRKSISVSLQQAKDEIEELKAELLQVHSQIQDTRESEQEINKLQDKVTSLDSEIANMKRIMDAGKRASARLSEISVSIDKMQNDVEELRKLRLQQSSMLAELASLNEQAVRSSEESRAIEKEIAEAKSQFKHFNDLILEAEQESAILDTVPCGGVGEYSSCPFLSRAIQRRSEIDDYVAGRDEAQAKLLAKEAELGQVRVVDMGMIKALGARLDKLKVRMAELESSERKLADAVKNRGSLEQAMRDGERAEVSLQHLESKRSELSAKIDEISLSISQSREALMRAQQLKSRLSAQEALVSKYTEQIAEIDAKLAYIKSQREHVQRMELQIKEQESKLVDANKDKRSWSLLSTAFGRTGIQSMEIDSCGPTVSAIANDLLLSCFGPRFSVSFVTQVPKIDGSGNKDEFDIYVIDSRSGRQGSLDDLSGGEKVIVSECASLAISLFNRQMSEVCWQTIWRDEASSAVDDERAPLYVQMLRRAMESGSFRRLFFVSHQSRATDAADARIIVSDGKLTIDA